MRLVSLLARLKFIAVEGKARWQKDHDCRSIGLPHPGKDTTAVPIVGPEWANDAEEFDCFMDEMPANTVAVLQWGDGDMFFDYNSGRTHEWMFCEMFWASSYPTVSEESIPANAPEDLMLQFIKQRLLWKYRYDGPVRFERRRCTQSTGNGPDKNLAILLVIADEFSKLHLSTK